MKKLAEDFGVRAWFGTIVLIFAMPTLCLLSYKGNEICLGGLIGIVSTVIAFYFGARSQKPPNNVAGGTT